MNRKILSLLFVLINLFVFSQTNSKRLDSLLEISITQEKLPLVSTLNEISWEFKNSNMDSAFFYARKALLISNKIKSKKAISFSYNSLANCFEAQGNLDSALTYHSSSLKIKKEIDSQEGVADSYNNLGIIYDTKGNYAASLKKYFEALRIYENEDVPFDKVPMVLSNIGIVYKKQKEFDKALKYYKRAYKIYKANNYDFGVVVTSGNIGSILLNLKAFDSSIVYSTKAKKMYSDLGYHRYVPYMTHNIAIALDSLKQHKKAQKLYVEVETQYEADKNLFELASTKLGLARSLLTVENFNQSKEKAKECLEISENQGFKELEVNAYKILSTAYAGLGFYEKAYNFSERHDKYKDSLFEESKTRIVFELETKYQTEKKEKEILAQRADLAEKDLDLNKKNTQLIGLVVLAIVVSILGYLLYNQQKLKNSQLKKEAELKEALVKIETQNRLHEQRLRISRDLHDNIGAQLTFVISSIENLQYGFKITDKKLTNKLISISDFTRETIYELRDTIWAMNKNEISLEDLQTRISNFIDKAGVSSKSIRFLFNIDPSLSEDMVFSSVIGMSIYRIIQEATHNAIKYAKASLVAVDINKVNKSIQITIKDDGTGFDENEIVYGSGLKNMKKRAEEINAIFSIESKLNQGTQVVLTLS
jgi:signal transduction histidine kinase